MTEKTHLKIRLTKPLRGYAGRALPQGEEVEASISRYGQLIVMFGRYRFPLKQDQRELVLTDEDLE